MMLIWIVIIFALFYYLLGGKFDFSSFKSNNALNQLDERLAKGEISINEYLELKSIIKESNKWIFYDIY